MYNISIIHKDGTLELKTEVRANARAVQLLAKENEIEVEVTEERAPRPVKFKDVD